MTVAVALLWAAALYRLWITVRGPRELWRLSFTAATVMVAVGMTAFSSPALPNAAVLNSAGLIVHGATTLAGGCIVIYLLTLSYARPPRLALRAAATVAASVTAGQCVLWTLAPIHQQGLPDLVLQAANSPILQVYFAVYYAYLIIVLLSTAVICARMATDSTRGYVIRSGLAIIAGSTSLGTLILSCFALRMFIRAAAGVDYHWLSDFGNLLVPASLCGLAGGTILFLIGPPLQERRQIRRTIVTLRPLHDDLVAHHPGLAFPMRQRSARIQLERMLIEIHDALHQTPVATSSIGDPYLSVATAIRRPLLDWDGHVPASTVLPSVTCREDDRKVLVNLAHTYVRHRRA